MQCQLHRQSNVHILLDMESVKESMDCRIGDEKTFLEHFHCLSKQFGVEICTVCIIILKKSMALYVEATKSSEVKPVSLILWSARVQNMRRA